MANKIKQKTKNKEIYYYRPDLQKFNREYNGFKSIDNVSKELISIFTEIKDMSLNKNDSRNVYIQRDSNTYNYVVVDFNNNDYIYGMLISSSNDVYPSIEQEGSQLVSNTNQLKMKAHDGKLRDTDVMNTEQILRLVQSI